MSTPAPAPPLAAYVPMDSIDYLRSMVDHWYQLFHAVCVAVPADHAMRAVAYELASEWRAAYDSAVYGDQFLSVRIALATLSDLFSAATPGAVRWEAELDIDMVRDILRTRRELAKHSALFEERALARGLKLPA